MGLHRIYGYPGDGINGFLGALDRADDDPSSSRRAAMLLAASAATAAAALAYRTK